MSFLLLFFINEYDSAQEICMATDRHSWVLFIIIISSFANNYNYSEWPNWVMNLIYSFTHLLKVQKAKGEKREKNLPFYSNSISFPKKKYFFYPQCEWIKTLNKKVFFRYKLTEQCVTCFKLLLSLSCILYF